MCGAAVVFSPGMPKMREARLWPRVTNGPPAVTPVAFLGTTMLRGTTKIVQKSHFPPQNSNLMQISQYN